MKRKHLYDESLLRTCEHSGAVLEPKPSSDVDLLKIWKPIREKIQRTGDEVPAWWTIVQVIQAYLGQSPLTNDKLEKLQHLMVNVTAETSNNKCARCADIFYDPKVVIEDYRQRAAEWEDVAKQWMRDHDKLKEKYEPGEWVMSEPASTEGGDK